MRFFIAFIISLLIYALLIWLYIAKLSDIKPLAKRKSEHIIKIDIKNIIPATPIIKPKPVAVVKKRVTKPKHKKIIKKKIIKKRVIKPKHKKVIKKKIIKKRVVKAEPVIIDNNILMQDFEILEPIKKVEKPVVKEEDNSLASFLGTPSKRVNQNRTYPNRKIKKLYGSNFHSFTSTQKRFIENNLDTIQSITQRVLTQRGYPEGAGRTHQEGTNVVSFNLHPNGTISDLRLKTRIGYRALDDNTLSLIRTAYREYPYPTTTTQIIFYVTYSIYGY